jgi:hypothetical protein
MATVNILLDVIEWVASDGIYIDIFFHDLKRNVAVSFIKTKYSVQ